MATVSIPEAAETMPRTSVIVSQGGKEEQSSWLLFAGTMLGLAGIMRILDSIWAFTFDGAIPGELQGALLGSDLTNYVWLWLGVGILLIASSFLILKRSQFARWVGYFAAAITAISAITWMPYFPIWSVTYIGIAVATFYALARHGGREASAQ